jgi:1,4-dihydroxy-2-naphthoyl-CoA hydrolase
MQLAGGGISIDSQTAPEKERLPFAELLGVKILSAEAEQVTAEMVVREDLCTNPAVLHGGAVMAFADTLGARATILNLRDGAWTTTIESKTNFFAPAQVGTRVLGECTPLHRGKRTMVWLTKVTSEQGRLLAIVTQTQMMLEAQKPG